MVFTLPEAQRTLVQHQRCALFTLLFQASSETLPTLSADPQRLGDLPAGPARAARLAPIAGRYHVLPDLAVGPGPQAPDQHVVRIRPHRTHQNGLSVDFLVPLRRADGTPDTIFPWVGNLWTYALDFDRRGCRGGRCIDFDALAQHLAALDRHARRNGLRLEQVILDPDYHAALLAAWRRLPGRTRLPLLERRAWVRHDEHYHVDFALARG